MAEFAGQVIIEKKFKSREAAENWMARLKAQYEPTTDNVETHLWEPVGSQRGLREN